MTNSREQMRKLGVSVVLCLPKFTQLAGAKPGLGNEFGFYPNPSALSIVVQVPQVREPKVLSWWGCYLTMLRNSDGKRRAERTR
jgi:hypothetical protein